MNFKTILLEETDTGILSLTINRPEQLNAINNDVLAELSHALDLIEENKQARVVVITGSGEKAFVAGADIEQMRQLTPVEAQAFSERGMAIFRRLENLSLPVIAMVNGFALGGGCELAMSCDFIIASDNAKFGQPEINLGITPGFGGSQRLTRIVGRPMALELLLTGRMMNAEEAAKRGLVNHVYPQEALAEEVAKLAKILAMKSRTALQLTKKLVQRGQDLDLDNACVLESHTFGLSFSTDDRDEGMSAFLEKRTANFS